MMRRQPAEETVVGVSSHLVSKRYKVSVPYRSGDDEQSLFEAFVDFQEDGTISISKTNAMSRGGAQNYFFQHSKPNVIEAFKGVLDEAMRLSHLPGEW